MTWMVENYSPWIKTPEDAVKSMAYLREKEGREFNLDKVRPEDERRARTRL